MWWLTAGVGLAQGVAGYDAARQAGRDKVALIEEETRENVRRAQRDFGFALGEQSATIGAGGVAFSAGSAGRQMIDARAEVDRQVDYMRRIGDLRVQQARRAARAAAKQSIFGGLTGAIGGVGSAFG